MLDLRPLSADEAADSETSALLRATQRRVGFIPNMQGIMANAPSALRLYAFGNSLLAQSSLSATERTVIFIAASQTNGCDYCVAAHSAGAKIGSDMLQSLHAGREIDTDKRLEALRRFVNRLVEKKGRLTREEVDELLDAGYEDRQVLEVITAIALKTLTNYIGHLVDIPVDDLFVQFLPTVEDLVSD